MRISASIITNIFIHTVTAQPSNGLARKKGVRRELRPLRTPFFRELPRLAEWLLHTYGSYGTGSKANRFFPTLGNHDWMTENAQPYFDYFTLLGNERYYDFEWGLAHLFAFTGELIDSYTIRADEPAPP